MKRYPHFATAALALLIAGCGPRERQADVAARDGILLIGNGEEPSALDPHVATSLAEAHVLYALFEGLVSPDPADPNAIAPGAAESWTLSPDGLVYTFRIREDATWSNGDPVTAQDFVDSAERALNPIFGASFPELYFDLANARAYYEEGGSDFASVGIKALDERTLRIALERPTQDFLGKLKHFAWMPIHRGSLESQGAWARRGARWFAPETIVSNGPFELVGWRSGSEIAVRKRSGHWDNDGIPLNAMRFLPYENAHTERLAYLGGQLHVTDKIPTEFAGETAATGMARQDPYLSTAYLIFNTRSGPLADPELRRSLALSLDKRELASAIERSGRPATSFTPVGISGYEPPVAARRDPQAARTALAAFRSAGEPPQLTIAVSNIPASRAMVEAVQAMWQETLGLTVEIRNMEAKSLFAALDSGSFEISYLSWTADYAAPAAFLDLWRSGNSKNRSGWSNAQYDALLDQAQAEPDPARRGAHYAEAESLLLDEAPLIPILWKTKNFYLAPHVRNWPPALLDMRSYRRVQLAPQTQ